MNNYYYQNQIIYTYKGVDVDQIEAMRLFKNGYKVKREVYHENGDITSLGYIK